MAGPSHQGPDPAPPPAAPPPAAPARSARPLALALAVALGIAAGMALVTARVSNATSYLSDSPAVCINCHVMNTAYATWAHGSHGRDATCNDCHVPHDNPLKTLAFKAADGLRHAYVFTLRLEPQTLDVNPAAIPVIQGNCVRCHADQLAHVAVGRAADDELCWRCHRETPHGRTLSLSSTPHLRRPSLPAAGMPRAETQEEPP